MQTSQNTTVTGATLGGAVGLVVAWLLETYTAQPIPDFIQGAIALICIALVSLLYPADPPA